MVLCNSLTFQSDSLSSKIRLLRVVGWYRFVCGFGFLFRKKPYIGNKSIATIDHQLQEKIEN